MTSKRQLMQASKIRGFRVTKILDDRGFKCIRKYLEDKGITQAVT